MVEAAPLQSRFRVTVNGNDISPAIAPVLQRISIRDAAGSSADTAEIELDDRAGSIVLPRAGAKMEVRLQDPLGLGLVFVGKVDEIHSRGDRAGGRILTISAKGADVLGPAKQLQELHFDDVEIGEALKQAGSAAGISDVRIDPELAKIQRAYVSLENESFLAFGERVAREVGGTFKVIGDRAILVKRNAGTTASGRPLGSVSAAYGRNLISWDIAPFVGRSRHKRTRVRHYDPQAAAMREATTEIADDSAEADLIVRYPSADAEAAQDQANATAAEVERRGGSGTVTINGDTSAKPEGVCSLSGVRPGIDGDYRIDAVEHTLDRSGGLTTRISLGQPHGSAGQDSRSASKPAALETLSFEEP